MFMEIDLEMKDFSTLGSRIRALRGKRLQAEYSSIFGIDRTTLGSWEKNRHVPNINILVMMAKLGGVSLDWLCANEGNISYDDELAANSMRWKKIAVLAIENNVEISTVKDFILGRGNKEITGSN